jgi:hypothetical protein
MTAVTVQKSSTTLEAGRIMIFEKACALMSAAMIAASVGLSNRNVPVVHAQELSIGGHYTVQPATRGNSLAGRIVVHPVHFKRWSDQIDDTSAAVLDYAASIMKNHPHSIIHVEMSSVPSGTESSAELRDELASQRMQAVTSYLQRKVVDTDKLVFVFLTIVQSRIF